MTEFKRVRSIEVPSDWSDISLDAGIRLERETIALNEELGLEEAELERRKKTISYSREDFFQFFETALATPEVADAIENQVPFYYREPDEKIPNPNWGETRTSFERWWISSRFDINDWGLSMMQTKYLIVTFPAFHEYFSSGDIQWAYEIMAKKLDNFGIV